MFKINFIRGVMMNNRYNGFDFIRKYINKNGDKYKFKGETVKDFQKWKEAVIPRLKKGLGFENFPKSKLSFRKIEQKEYKEYILEKVKISTMPSLEMPFYIMTPKKSNGKNIIALHGHGCNGKEGLISSEKNEEKTTNFNKAEADSDAGAAVFVNSSTDTSYFVQAKLDREQSRAKQKDMLNEMLNNEKATSEQKNEATTAMLQIQKRIEKENAAEDMLKAKGFSEVYVRMDDDTVDVVVDKEKLTDAEIAQIEDTIKRKTGLPADKIRITPFKKSSK